MSRLVLRSTRPASYYSGSATSKKAPRIEPQRLASSSLCRRSGLLDRREFPVGPARPHEGPHLRHLGRLFAARDQPAGGALDGLVDQREPHRHAGVVGIALAPRLREVALQQLDVGNLVDVVAGLVLLEILGEIRHHFGRRQRMQLGDILVRPRGLNLTEQSLEGLVVARSNLKWRAARPQPETRSGSQGVQGSAGAA